MRRRTHPSASPRVRVRRLPERGRYDREAIDAVLDAGLVAHLGFVSDGQPYVIPTLQARVDDQVYVHGSAASRTLRALSGDIPVCLTVTLLDGIVLARSVFEHSMNYRSVVVLGTAVTRRRAGREARRAAGVHREAPARPLGGGEAAHPEGAEGDLGAPPSRRRGVRQDPRRRAGGRRHAGRGARRLGRPPASRRAGARAGARPVAATRDPRAARPLAVPAAGARPIPAPLPSARWRSRRPTRS